MTLRIEDFRQLVRSSGRVDGGPDAGGADGERGGSPPTGTVRVTRAVAGSIRSTAPFGAVGDPDAACAGDDADRVQADPRHGGGDGVDGRVDPADRAGVAVQHPDRAAPEGDADRVRRGRPAVVAIGIRAVTRPVCGSRRRSVAGEPIVTQIDPAPAATPSIPWPSSSRRVTAPVSGATRKRVDAPSSIHTPLGATASPAGSPTLRSDERPERHLRRPHEVVRGVDPDQRALLGGEHPGRAVADGHRGRRDPDPDRAHDPPRLEVETRRRSGRARRASRACARSGRRGSASSRAGSAPTAPCPERRARANGRGRRPRPPVCGRAREQDARGCRREDDGAEREGERRRRARASATQRGAPARRARRSRDRA